MRFRRPAGICVAGVRLAARVTTVLVRVSAIAMLRYTQLHPEPADASTQTAIQFAFTLRPAAVTSSIFTHCGRVLPL
uniref:Secreted protein n=1 Tax=Ascaris lumbricoides TaxID=6252 RepID=A0A0M3HR97_ASCLU